MSNKMKTENSNEQINQKSVKKIFDLKTTVDFLSLFKQREYLPICGNSETY